MIEKIYREDDKKVKSNIFKYIFIIFVIVILIYSIYAIYFKKEEVKEETVEVEAEEVEEIKTDLRLRNFKLWYNEPTTYWQQRNIKYW